MAGTKRFTIANLVPEEAYAIQTRSVDNGDSSRWSRKFSFTTIGDATQGGPDGGLPAAPNTPTLNSWQVTTAGFTAVWTAVTQMNNGNPTTIAYYELELSNVGGGTKLFKYTDDSTPTVTYSFTPEQMISFFGQLPTTVNLRLRAVNTAGTVSAWSNSIATAAGTPNPPTGAVVVEGADEIKISWTAPVGGAPIAGYHVYTGSTAGFTPSAANLIYEGAAPTYTYGTATYSLQYFKIRSYTVWGIESTDLTASGTPESPFTLDTSPPGLPVLSGSLSTSSVLPRYADLTWTFNTGTPGNEDVAGFVIAWRKVGDTNWSQDYASVELRAMRIELPLPFADYEFKIAAYDRVGNYSAYTSPVLSLNGSIAGAPAQVTGVASTASLDMFRITWTANSEADVVYGGRYDVDIATNNTFTTGLQTYQVGTNAIEISGLVPNTTYYYRVRAVDVGGTAGAYSATGSRTTPNFPATKTDGVAPSSSPTPTLVSGVGYITALWPRITNNDLVTYEVHISTTTGFTPGAGTHVADTTATSLVIRTTAADVALTYGTTYYVKLIAKDADGAAAAGTQASASPAQAVNADIADVSAGKLTAGTVSAATIILGTGGIFRTNNSDVIITDTGITVGANSTISAAAMQAGTAFVDDLGVQSTFTISASGVIKSNNYVPSTTGFQLSATGLDIRSGTISAGTLVAGTITSSGINIGAGGTITVDSTGVIKSNNFVANTTGWQIAATGIQLNDANSQISAAAIKTSTLGAVSVTIGSGGTIKSSDYNGTSLGWQLASTGLTMYAGTIQGAAVYTNQLASLSTDANSPLPPIPGQSVGAAFGINAAGKAVFSGALIYGNTVLGSGTAHFIQSNTYTAGSAGWKIRGDGFAEFTGLQVSGTSKVGGTLSSITTGWSINGDGTASFTKADMKIGTSASNTIWIMSSSNQGQIRFYPQGEVAGVSSIFSRIYGTAAPFGTADLIIQADSGAQMTMGDNKAGPSGTLYANCVRIDSNATVFGTMEATNVKAFSQLEGDPIFDWVSTGSVTDAEFGTSGRLRRKASSLRYKENVRALGTSPKKILALEPKSFQWKDREFFGDHRDAGFIAEEAHDLGLTEFVSYDLEGRPDGFRYANYTAALAQVARAQQAELDELRARVEELER